MFSLNQSDLEAALWRFGAELVDTFVETGLERGGTFGPVVLSNRFAHAIAVERDRQLALSFCDRLAAHAFDQVSAPAPNTRFVQVGRTLATVRIGDTREIVPDVCAAIDRPVVWHLDAHTPDQVPLLAELDAIATRRERGLSDLVIVDDVRCFGFRSQLAPSPAWRQIGVDDMLARFPQRPERRGVIYADRLWFRT